MREYSLNGVKRAETGKKAAKNLRAQGQIPCVLIGKDSSANQTSVTFSVNLSDLRHLIYTSQVYLVNLTIDGEPCKAIVKEMQFGPVNEEVYHIDFLKIDETAPITVNIPVKLEGHAEGVKAGGKLVKQLRDLRVKGLWTNIPERLIVDVANIALGKTMKVGELQYEGLEILTSPEAIVAGVRATRASRQQAQGK